MTATQTIDLQDIARKATQSMRDRAGAVDYHDWSDTYAARRFRGTLLTGHAYVVGTEVHATVYGPDEDTWHYAAAEALDSVASELPGDWRIDQIEGTYVHKLVRIDASDLAALGAESVVTTEAGQRGAEQMAAEGDTYLDELDEFACTGGCGFTGADDAERQAHEYEEHSSFTGHSGY